MSEQALIATQPVDTVVNLRGVSKIFTQWQRESTAKGLLRNLLHPEKKIISALDDVSFTVQRGEFVAYAGPNGAGKSTTMKLLAGILQPSSGNLSVLGLSPVNNRIQVMHRIGVLFGNRTELWWDHPIEQSFAWKKVVWDIPDAVYKRNLDMFTELLDIGNLLKTFARELSLGQRMRADLAMMLLHSPELILLDEPTLGLDVVAKRQMIDFLKKINREDKVSIMVTSHDMDDLEEMAERILMIAQGKIAYDGSFEGLREITGNITHLSINLASEEAPSLDGALHLGSENGIHEYEIDLSQIPIQKILQQLSAISNLKDIEISKAPIEKIIANLYSSWQ